MEPEFLSDEFESILPSSHRWHVQIYSTVDQQGWVDVMTFRSREAAREEKRRLSSLTDKIQYRVFDIVKQKSDDLMKGKL